jgi:predicted Fe-Mo cluster-binding NifX family protein
MRIAITSNSGKYVDTHFGKAERVVVYEISSKFARLAEIRNINKYCGVNGHGFNEDAFNAIYDKIADCDKLYTQNIGDTPAAKLTEKGIMFTTADCIIEEIPVLKNKKII